MRNTQSRKHQPSAFRAGNDPQSCLFHSLKISLIHTFEAIKRKNQQRMRGYRSVFRQNRCLRLRLVKGWCLCH